MDQFSQEEGERKAKTLKDQEEEEPEETDLIEDVEAAPQENRIKDPVNRHSQNPNTLWLCMYVLDYTTKTWKKELVKPSSRLFAFVQLIFFAQCALLSSIICDQCLGSTTHFSGFLLSSISSNMTSILLKSCYGATVYPHTLTLHSSLITLLP